MGKRTDIMLFRPFEEKRLDKWNPPYIVQAKLDGERARCLEFKDQDYNSFITVLSSENNSCDFAVPHILAAYKKVCQSCYSTKYPELDGELYNHEIYLQGGFSAIHSITSRTVNLHPDHAQMEFHYFDLIEDAPQWLRLQNLDQLNLPHPFKRIPTYFADTLDDVMRAYDKILEQGYEGIVVRHMDAPYLRCGATQRRTLYGMKFKPKQSDIYRIVGYSQMVDKDGRFKEQLGSLICADPDGNEFSVGSGLDDEFRQTHWPPDNLIGLFIKVEYQHITSGNRVPRFPVIYRPVTLMDGEPEVELFDSDWPGLE